MKPIYRDDPATTSADRRVVAVIARPQAVRLLRAISQHLEESENRID